MSDDEKDLRELLGEAGPRPPLAETDLERIRAAARAEWRGRWASGRAGSRRWPWAVAAALFLGAATLLWVRRAAAPATAPGVATVDRLTGDVAWTARGTPETGLAADAVGRPIPEGAAIETRAAGRLALRLAGGASVRLDAATRAKLASASVVELESGTVYVDTGGPAAGHESVAVRTAAGVFRSIGTQFAVQLESGATRLRVREGRVRLERGADTLSTDAGQELVVRRDGSVERHETAADGPEWQWIAASAPMPDIEGMKVRSFLDWLARERGWRVEFADAETAALADSVVLHGSIAHLTPVEAPDVVLPSSGLGYRVAKGKLVVFVTGDVREPVRTPR